MLCSHIRNHFLYYFARTCTTLQGINRIHSNMDPSAAKTQRYLRIYSARLRSLVSLFSLPWSLQAFTLGLMYHGFYTILDHQPPALTSWVDHLLVVLFKMINKWLNRCSLVFSTWNDWSLGKIYCFFLSLFKKRNLLLFQFLS